MWIKNGPYPSQRTPSEPIYIVQGWHMWNSAYSVVSTRIKHLTSKPHRVKGGAFVWELSVHIYFLPCPLNETCARFIRNKLLTLFQQIQKYGHTVGGLVNCCAKFTALHSAVTDTVGGWGGVETGISTWGETIIKKIYRGGDGGRAMCAWRRRSAALL